MIKAAVGVETEGYTHQLYFNYPSHGGIESLPRALAERVRNITPDFTVDRIWKEAGQWCVSNGRTTRRYDQLVSTIPIQELAHALRGTPPEIIAAVDSLRYNSLVTVAVGLDSARLPDYTAIYVPDPEDPLSSAVVSGGVQPAQRAVRASRSSRPKSPPIRATARTKCRTKRSWPT